MNLPTAEAATAVIDTLYNNVFFQGLASQGIAPTTEKDASDLCQVANDIRVVQTRQTKTANDHQVLSVLATPVMKAHSDAEILKIASEIAADPVAYNAVLSTIVAEQMIADGLGTEADVVKTAYTLDSATEYLRHKLAESLKTRAA